jgi:hypothetical protein
MSLAIFGIGALGMTAFSEGRRIRHSYLCDPLLQFNAGASTCASSPERFDAHFLKSHTIIWENCAETAKSHRCSDRSG